MLLSKTGRNDWHYHGTWLVEGGMCVEYWNAKAKTFGAALFPVLSQSFPSGTFLLVEKPWSTDWMCTCSIAAQMRALSSEMCGKEGSVCRAMSE